MTAADDTSVEAGSSILEASPCFRLRTRIAPSRLAGAGLAAFALEAAPRGTLLGIDLPQSAWMISAPEALLLPRRERSQTWRHVEDICFRGGEGRVTASNYLNHSFQPNVLWHLGCYWTLQDLEPGDELTLDYRPLIDPTWSHRIVDAASGQPLIGQEGKKALLDSAKALVSLLESVLQDDESPPPTSVGDL
jgi:cell wall assembly regulator SMI1